MNIKYSLNMAISEEIHRYHLKYLARHLTDEQLIQAANEYLLKPITATPANIARVKADKQLILLIYVRPDEEDIDICEDVLEFEAGGKRFNEEYKIMVDYLSKHLTDKQFMEYCHKFHYLEVKPTPKNIAVLKKISYWYIGFI